MCRNLDDMCQTSVGLVVFVGFLGGCLGELNPRVTIDQGILKGIYLESTLGRRFAAFMSVPFAQPPTGTLRFKAPLEAKGWEGERDASVDAPICIQNNPYTREKEISGTEDCLYLNVYTPKEPLEEGRFLPVMVFFHGGGWMCGSGNKMFYGPERLMDRDVVYVGVNYRLGTLSFFSTADKVAPGNYALKDQNVALKWIQRNIKQFAGDPDSVTIFGESAGGASVHYHMLSPKSKGLFHKAISHSGTAFCSWANPAPGTMLKQANKLALEMNCPTGDSLAMVECLRTKTAKELIAADKHLYDWDYDPMIPFKPTVEPEHEDAFLTEDPRVLAVEGRFHQVPWMLGLNARDGALRSANIFGNPELLKELSQNFDKLAPITFDYQNSENVDHITEKIKNFYFEGSSIISNDSILPLTDIYTDSYFLSGIDEALRLHFPNSEKSIYFYHFGYRGSNSFSTVFGDPWRDYGACHVDELIYLFPLGLFPDTLNKKDASISDAMLTLWTNFATTGNPNDPQSSTAMDLPQWTPVTSPDEMEYIDISNKISMDSRLMEQRRNLWKGLPLWQKSHSDAYRRQSVKTEL